MLVQSDMRIASDHVESADPGLPTAKLRWRRARMTKHTNSDAHNRTVKSIPALKTPPGFRSC
jgi:hypothetical protein